MKAILTEAVAVGNATARAIAFTPRDPRAPYYPDRQWYTPFVGGSYQFIDGAERMLDARVLFHYLATGITPAMATAKPGSGSAYVLVARDSQGRYFAGGKTYKVMLPAPIPAGNFWSFAVYDTQLQLRFDKTWKPVTSKSKGLADASRDDLNHLGFGCTRKFVRSADDRVELDLSTRLAYNRTRQSKVIFAFLMLTFSLTEGASAQPAPMVTIPAR